MSRRNRRGPNKRDRRAPPRIDRKNGQIAIACPFCWPPHTIISDIPARCGTLLELTAVQQTYQAVECALCGKINGTLVRIGERYKHAHDCTPGRNIYTVPPDRSKFAALLWNAPAFVHQFIAKRWGRVVVELGAPDEKKTYGWDIVRTIPMRVSVDG